MPHLFTFPLHTFDYHNNHNAPLPTLHIPSITHAYHNPVPQANLTPKSSHPIHATVQHHTTPDRQSEPHVTELSNPATQPNDVGKPHWSGIEAQCRLTKWCTWRRQGRRRQRRWRRRTRRTPWLHKPGGACGGWAREMEVGRMAGKGRKGKGREEEVKEGRGAGRGGWESTRRVGRGRAGIRGCSKGSALIGSPHPGLSICYPPPPLASRPHSMYLSLRLFPPPLPYVCYVRNNDRIGENWLFVELCSRRTGGV